MCRAKSVVWLFILAVVASDSKTNTNKTTEVPTLATKIESNSTPALNSRFFDLGGMFNQIFPGQGESGGNNYPDNSQFYPAISIQDQNPSGAFNQGNGWPIIDDAKQFPNQGGSRGSSNTQYPNQVGFGGSQYPNTQYPNEGVLGGSQNNQYPNQGGVGGSPNNQYPNQGGFGGSTNNMFPNQGGFGGSSNTQYPNQGDFGSLPNEQYPNQGGRGGSLNTQYPNQGDFGGSTNTQYPNQGSLGGSLNTQYPNQGGLGGSINTQYPSQGSLGGSLNTQYPNQGGLGGSTNTQYPNQGGLGGSLNTQYPNQGGLGGSTNTQYPNQGGLGGSLNTQYPNQGGLGGSANTQYPNQGSFGGLPPTNQGNIGGSQQNPNQGSGGGTLDDIVPPKRPLQPSPYDLDDPNPIIFPGPIQQGQRTNAGGGSDGTTAILGRPVVLPSNPTDAGRVNFPSSTQNPSQIQCVQDCQSTSEYNPVCGTNNVTYFNPGKFVCARNCGVDVYYSKAGRCPGDTPSPRNVIFNG